MHRYLLLLKELMRRIPAHPSDPLTTQVLSDLGAAHDALAAVTTALNTSLSAAESIAQLKNLSRLFLRTDSRFQSFLKPGRKLVKMGVLRKKFSSKSYNLAAYKSYFFFLTNVSALPPLPAHRVDVATPKSCCCRARSFSLCFHRISRHARLSVCVCVSACLSVHATPICSCLPLFLVQDLIFYAASASKQKEHDDGGDETGASSHVAMRASLSAATSDAGTVPLYKMKHLYRLEDMYADRCDPKLSAKSAFKPPNPLKFYMWNNDGRVIVLQAATEAERDAWYEAIDSAIEVCRKKDAEKNRS